MMTKENAQRREKKKTYGFFTMKGDRTSDLAFSIFVGDTFC
jgi:hypothetical protein